MFEFGLYALILLLMALGFIVVPMLLSKTVVRQTDDETNIKLAQNKLKELKAELAAGNISQIQFSTAKHELEVGLFHDLHDGGSLAQPGGNGRWLALPLAFIVPVAALALYLQLGDFRAFDPNAARPVQTELSREDQIVQMVNGLAQRLEQQPNDLQGWIMLGRSYKAMKRYPDAVGALRKALALQPDNPDLMLQLADAAAMTNNGSLQGEPNQLIEQALKLNPDNEMGMWLLGLSKAEAGQYDLAIAIWRKLQQRYQPDDKDYQEVQQLIDTALKRAGREAEIGATPAPAAQAAAAAAKAGGSVNVEVTLDPRYQPLVNDGDSVMIYVKAANGPKMPLAAVKRQVKDLPLKITLDDSMAMMPNMTVSAFEDLQVTARVSRSGNAMPQAGEPVGSVAVKGEQRNAVTVVINDQVR